MGFFDSLGSLIDAATPWVTVEAEALTHGDTSTDKTPANSDNGDEGESMVGNFFPVHNHLICLGETQGRDLSSLQLRSNYFNETDSYLSHRTLLEPQLTASLKWRKREMTTNLALNKPRSPRRRSLLIQRKRLRQVSINVFSSFSRCRMLIVDSSLSHKLTQTSPECRESKQCSAPKHHFDECVERVTSGHNKKYPNEDCVEECRSPYPLLKFRPLTFRFSLLY
jgi:hypothetical protein